MDQSQLFGVTVRPKRDDEENATRPIGSIAAIGGNWSRLVVGCYDRRVITCFMQSLYLKYDLFTSLIPLRPHPTIVKGIKCSQSRQRFDSGSCNHVQSLLHVYVPRGSQYWRGLRTHKFSQYTKVCFAFAHLLPLFLSSSHIKKWGSATNRVQLDINKKIIDRL